MKSISVFCGSSMGNQDIFIQAARDLGATFATKNLTLVYGAGNVGLMGIIADAALEKGGKVIGVIPDFLKKWEVCHMGLTELHITETMHQRKQMMAELSEGIIALPGGFGTMDEVFDILTLAQLQQAHHPVGILNVAGYYDHLMLQLDKMVAAGFLKQDNRDMVLISDNLEDLLQLMNDYRTGTGGKWLDDSLS